jgi:hypothetical protein
MISATDKLLGRLSKKKGRRLKLLKSGRKGGHDHHDYQNKRLLKQYEE